MLSVVIPAYNEAENIRNNLFTVCEIISRYTDDFELVPVNDGSSDGTEEELRLASQDERFGSRINIVSYQPNRGKGGAIKAGVTAARGDIIGFLDADLDISPDHITTYLEHMNQTGADIVIGSKMHPESKLEYPLARKFFSWGYYIMLKMIFGLNVKDTQTGVKLFRADLIKEIAPMLRVSGYAFDIEILALAADRKARIDSMPVSIEFTRKESFGRIKISDIVRMFTDTLGIWWNLRIRRTYK